MQPQVYPFIGNPTFRPFVPVNIINPNTKARIIVYGLLDTGGDSCIFPSFIPEKLGYVLKDGVLIPNNKGLGGDKDAWSHQFKIELLDEKRKNVVWKSKELPIRCVEQNDIPPILGFSDFMCHFRISFNHSSKRIVIQDPV